MAGVTPLIEASLCSPRLVRVSLSELRHGRMLPHIHIRSKTNAPHLQAQAFDDAESGVGQREGAGNAPAGWDRVPAAQKLQSKVGGGLVDSTWCMSSPPAAGPCAALT